MVPPNGVGRVDGLGQVATGFDRLRDGLLDLFGENGGRTDGVALVIELERLVVVAAEVGVDDCSVVGQRLRRGFGDDRALRP